MCKGFYLPHGMCNDFYMPHGMCNRERVKLGMTGIWTLAPKFQAEHLTNWAICRCIRNGFSSLEVSMGIYCTYCILWRHKQWLEYSQFNSVRTQTGRMHAHAAARTERRSQRSADFSLSFLRTFYRWRSHKANVKVPLIGIGELRKSTKLPS